MEHDPEGPDHERGESEAEREDRKWEDILQELRVMQTSAQLTAGFLLTLPFQQSFADLTKFQQSWYLALVVLAAVVVALVLAPVAIHRRLSGHRIKGRVVASGHVLIRTALGLLVLLVASVAAFIFHVVASPTAAVVAGAALAVLMILLHFVLPAALARATSE
jgi:uncharacterized membrane protein